MLYLAAVIKYITPSITIQRRRKVLEIGGALTIDNTVRPYYLCTDGGVCVSTHTLRGSGGMVSQKNF